MPVFEGNYNATGRGPDGESVALSPQQALAQLGPILHVSISPTPDYIAALGEQPEGVPDPVTGIALIDTGATKTAVDEKVCKHLRLPAVGVVRMSHAAGSEMRNVYAIQMTFPGTPLPSMVLTSASSVDLSGGGQPYILLIGRDILQNLKMTYNGPRGRLELAF